jgi:hypothetical protein
MGREFDAASRDLKPSYANPAREKRAGNGINAARFFGMPRHTVPGLAGLSFAGATSTKKPFV